MPAVIGAWSLALCSVYLVLGPWSLVRGSVPVVLRIWYFVIGSLHAVFGNALFDHCFQAVMV